MHQTSVPSRHAPRTKVVRASIAAAFVVGVISPASTWVAQPAAAAGRPGPTRAVVEECDTPAATARGCDVASLKAINVARGAEGLADMVLPPDYETLDLVQQLVVVTNAERLARDLPAWHGPDRALGELAVPAVTAGEDPAGPAGTTWASNLATGVLTVLQADYEWMYDDGPGSINRDCTTSNRSGCWEHRENILSPWAGMIGAAAQPVNSRRLVVGEIMVASS